MAAVWRARDGRLGRDVALKVLHRNLPYSSSMRDRMEREAKVAASLTHENIVQVYDYSVGLEGDSYIAMELVDGRTLREVLDERKTLPWVVVALASYELCRGLSYAHDKGVVHRDLKPDNVMVSRTGSLKIGDFGIARSQEATQLTATGVPVGTPAYLSPEQIRGEAADTRSDMFALGVSLYELSTGRLPFDAETTTGIMYQIVEGRFIPPEQLGLADIDLELADIINRCLSPKREDRPTAVQIVERVGRMLQQRQVVDPRHALVRYFVDGIIPLTEVQPVSQRTRMPPAKWLGAGVALVALASLGTWGFLREVSPPHAPPAAVATTPTPPAPEPVPPVAPVAAAPTAEPMRMPETMLEPEQMNAGGPSRENHPPPPAAKPGKHAPAAVTARPASGGDRTHGTLYLTVLGGWADVRVDGVVLGRTPTEREFQLKAGTHMLELSNPHRAPFRKVVHIPPGGTLKQEVELQPQP
jgi:serine/threonine-protein kinase